MAFMVLEVCTEKRVVNLLVDWKELHGMMAERIKKNEKPSDSLTEHETGFQ